MMNSTQTEHCIDTCNSLLRGEISAIETYTQAIDKYRGEADASVLADLRRDHIESANRLRHNVREMGGEPTTDSGAWGAWAKTIEGAAKLMGETAALKALLEGEEHGRKEYQDALASEDMLPACKEMIRSELLPRQDQHIAQIRRLMKQK